MSGEATIRRGVRNARYAAIPNHVFEDARLSMEARWLLSYLLSKPDNWTVVIGDIIKKGNCGRDKARKMIAELVELGYAEREQQREDGKFGSSVLVIYDEPREWGEGDRPASDQSVANLPQTDLPATAKPAPASPAPVKSALSNNLDSLNTDCYQVREGASECVDEEDHRSILRSFKRWYPNWPTYVSDSEPAAFRAWESLTPDDRINASEMTSAYVTAVKGSGRKMYCSAGIYLTERRWEKLPRQVKSDQPAAVHNPFSRAWMARRLHELSQPETQTKPVMTAWQRREFAKGNEAADRVMTERREKYGWPKVTTMDERAAQAQGVTVPADLAALATGFEKVGVDDEVFAAWQDIHKRMGWPRLSVPDPVEWLYFPALPQEDAGLDALVAEALARFQTEAMRGGQ